MTPCYRFCAGIEPQRTPAAVWSVCHARPPGCLGRCSLLSSSNAAPPGPGCRGLQCCQMHGERGSFQSKFHITWCTLGTGPCVPVQITCAYMQWLMAAMQRLRASQLWQLRLCWVQVMQIPAVLLTESSSVAMCRDALLGSVMGGGSSVSTLGPHFSVAAGEDLVDCSKDS